MKREKYIDLLTITILLMAIIFLPEPEKWLEKKIPAPSNKIIYTKAAADFYEPELYFNTGFLDIINSKF